MIVAGIDAGSRSVKVVVLEASARRVLGTDICDQGVSQSALASDLYHALLARLGIAADEVARVVATGYGRHAIGFAHLAVTEITCHARGVRHLAPDARTVVDIGGQDSKLIRLDRRGDVQDFAMNDRCAAGTGRFLELVATRLGVRIGELGALAARAKTPAVISSMCAVFAETEIVGLLADGVAPQDIVAGVQNAIASRIAAMAGRRLDEPVLFTGGVALVPGMSAALERALGRHLTPAPQPQITGALGAALVAAEAP